MARDYKRSRKTAKKKAGSSPWTFLGYGFALGLIAALGLYLQLRPAELEPPDRPVPNASIAPQSSNDTEEAPAQIAQPATSTTATETPKPLPAPVENEYGFYKELPDFEMVVADENNQPVAARPAAPKPIRPAAAPGEPATYILQAGSFRKFVDADRRKAELAFKGIESNIQQVVLKEEEIWYRVYVGPGSDFAAFENMRSELRRSNIDVLILKVRQ